MKTRLLLGVIVCFVAGERASTQTQNPADGPWAGWIRCQVTAQGPGYSDQQTHTWIMSAGAPRVEGVFRIYPATWTVVGGGALQRTQGANTVTARWATNGQAPNAPIAVWTRGDGRLVFTLRHDQLRATSGFTGYRFYTVDGKQQPTEQIAAETYEYRFQPIDDASASAISGSTTLAIPPSNAFTPQPGSNGSVSCTWQFGIGAAAPAPPAPLQAQATPTPSGTATPPSPPAVATAPPAALPVPLPLPTPGPIVPTPTPAPSPSPSQTPSTTTAAISPTSPILNNGALSDLTPSGGLTAAPGPPAPPTTQEVIGSCTLRGPDNNRSWASPRAAYLWWEPVAGATSYTVLRSDLGVLRRGILPYPPTTQSAVTLSFRHDALLQTGGTYVYIVMAEYPQGCGATGINLSPNFGTTRVSLTIKNRGALSLSWNVYGVADVTGVHIEGPGLMQGGIDQSNFSGRGDRADGYSFGVLDIVGIPAGSRTWTVTPYWDTAGGRVMAAATSATTDVP